MLLTKIRKKIKKRIRETWYNRISAFLKELPEFPGNKGDLRILIYHGICRSEHLKFNSRFLTEAIFEAHLKAIKKYFNPVSFEDYKNNNLSKEKLNVMLTFDDGLENNYELALPLLLKHKVPAVFFLSMVKDRTTYLFNDLLDVFSLIGPEIIKINGVKFIKRKKYIHFRYMTSDEILLSSYFQDTNEEQKKEIEKQIYKYVAPEKFLEYKEYLALMNEGQIKEMASSKGITVGTHGVSHSDFSAIESSELQKELMESKARLENITGQPCGLVAFPYGNYDQATLKMCSEQGYNYLFGTEKLNKPEDRKRVIERMTVNPFTSAINQMYYIAKNSYE